MPSSNTLKGRLFAVLRKKRNPRQQLSMDDRDDWLANTIRFAKSLQAAGELVPFPYIKGAVGMFIALLEPIQQMTKNRDDYKHLVETITAILQQLQQDVISNPDIAKSSEIFKEQCAEVHVCLSKISSDLQLKFSPTNMGVFGEVWSSGSLRDLISRYQKDIDELRNNLILRVSIHTHLQVESVKVNLASLLKEDEGDISEYRSYTIGDVRLIDQVLVRFKGYTMYKSKIHNCGEQKTVKLYQGTDAQKRWKEDFELISSIRHPHIQQLFGIVQSKSHPGLIFHEEAATPIHIYRATLNPIKHAILNYNLIQTLKSVNYYLPREGIFWAKDFVDFHTGTSCCFNALVDGVGRIFISIEPKPPISGMYIGADSQSIIPVTEDTEKTFRTIQEMDLSKRIEFFFLLFRPFIYEQSPYQLRDCHDPRTIGTIEGDMIEGDMTYYNHTVNHRRYQLGTIPLDFILSRKPSMEIRHIPYGDNPMLFKANKYLEAWTRFSRQASWYGPCRSRPYLSISYDSEIYDINIRVLWETNWCNNLLLSSSLPFIQQQHLLFEDADFDPTSLCIRLISGVRYSITVPTFGRPKPNERTYLFVKNPTMDDQGTFTIPETFWSTDPCGNYRMSESELIRIGLVPPRIDIIPIVMQIGHNFHTSMLDYLAAFYHAQGLDLLSNATVFQLLNLPIVEDLGILKPLRKMPKLLISGLGIDQRKAQDDLELFLGGLPIDHANGLRHSTRCHLERNYCQILHRQKLKAATTACYDLADCGPLRRRILNERCEWSQADPIDFEYYDLQWLSSHRPYTIT